MIKPEFENTPDTEFVPLKEGIDSVFHGKYEINKLGQIKTLKTNRITSIYYNRHGKIPVKSFRVGNRKESYPVHLLVAKTFLIKEEGKPEVDHINRDTLDFRLINLRWVSRKENLENRKPLQTNKYIIYQKLDDNGDLIEELSSSEIKSSKMNYINKSIIGNKKAYGFFWKRIDLELEDYIKKHNLDLTKEVFIQIPGDPRKRQISSNGIILEYGWIYSIGWGDIGGYRKISINKHPKYIHRLVYDLFSGDKLSSSDYIDHVDTDPQNNCLNNLKLGTQKDNMNNPITLSKLSKGVNQIDISTGKIIKYFSSIIKACESLGKSDYSSISKCCNGKRKTAYGYKWEYADKNNNNKI